MRGVIKVSKIPFGNPDTFMKFVIEYQPRF